MRLQESTVEEALMIDLADIHSHFDQFQLFAVSSFGTESQCLPCSPAFGERLRPVANRDRLFFLGEARMI